MLFNEVVGNTDLKAGLIKEVKTNRVSHAQLFLGPEGTGKLPLATAFAQYLLCDNPTDKDACGTCQQCKNVLSLTHPDLHFVFPIVKSKKKHIASSKDCLKEWNAFFKREPNFALRNWLVELDELGKNPVISVEESQQILKKLALKSFSGKYKIMIIWLPELMNTSAANKLLKLLEEPPEKTVFILVSNTVETILPTILSRTQIKRVNRPTNEEITNYLIEKYSANEDSAAAAANLSHGNLTEAIDFIQGTGAQSRYFDLFVKLMRAAYTANPMDLMGISDEIAACDKETQKNFVKYGLHIFRESIIQNYMKGELSNLQENEGKFLQNFARFINNQNITELMEEFNLAHYHLERNASAKILFSDLSIKLTKLIKKGA